MNEPINLIFYIIFKIHKVYIVSIESPMGLTAMHNYLLITSGLFFLCNLVFCLIWCKNTRNQI